MKPQKLEAALAASYPVDRDRLDRIDIEMLEADLLADVDAGAQSATEPVRSARHGHRVMMGLAAAGALIAAVAIVLLGGDSGPGSPTPAYGARLVRFAESTPLLLIEAPGWHVNGVDQVKRSSGSMGFEDKGELPADERRAQLNWLPIANAAAYLRGFLHPPIDHTPGRRLTIALPALGATVHIDTRAESAPRYGRPGDHEMWALWTEGDHVLLLSSRVPSLTSFRERLEALRQVDSQTWLEAMPAEVVKAANYGAAVKKMLHGIPLPPGFDPAKIPNLELTTDRYQVGAAVGGAVACAWFKSWGKARFEGDTAAVTEAEHVLLGAEKRWPIFRRMATEGGYPATVTEYAEHMHSGRWYGKPLLQAVDSRGGLCVPESAAQRGR